MSGRATAVLRALLRDERGQTMAEYGIIAGVLGVCMIAGVGVLQQAASGILSAASGGWVNLALNPP